MITTELNGCKISILPIVKGLVSEYDRVKSQIDDSYDCVAVALSIEDIEIFAASEYQDIEYDPSDFDAVYAHFLKQFGEVDVPVPAFKAVVDACRELDIKPVPLEMCDEEFTAAYCECVKVWDLLKEKRKLKKAMKKGFDMSSPEAFLKGWDEMAGSIKGNYAMILRREEHMAKELFDLTNYKKSILAIIEYERVDGVLQELGAKI
ncbi:MAG: hypothetical protein J6R75_05395 [Candidatus Methanomethylophilaceae archaeon]|nr:hypothetical protein [Candidatus Methanomethylophilaceae archaeon]